jgi:hypothetical protein
MEVFPYSFTPAGNAPFIQMVMFKTGYGNESTLGEYLKEGQNENILDLWEIIATGVEGDPPKV